MTAETITALLGALDRHAAAMAETDAAIQRVNADDEDAAGGYYRALTGEVAAGRAVFAAGVALCEEMRRTVQMAAAQMPWHGPVQ